MNIWIKLLCVFIIRILLRIFYLFKVKNDRILAFSFAGSQYSCSPKYIFEHFLYENKNYEFIFAVQDIEKFKYLAVNSIKLVKFKSFKFLFYSLTSKVFITNGMPPRYIPFRNKQFVLSTWHGGGAYKKGGLDVVDNLPTRLLITFSATNLTGMISSCKQFTEIFHKAFLIEYKKFLNIGMPRNDILINRNKDYLYSKVYSYLNISKQDRMLLYAPTFRSHFTSIEGEATEGDYNIDFEKLKNALINKYGGNWKVVYRAHYFLQGKENDSCIDGTNYPDMQELLYVSDILITDYSSCMWDFSLMYKPCFIYATDIDQYKQERDFYTPMSEWPFPIATNTDELINNIVNFDEKEYIEKVKKHHQALGSYEDGHACERVCKLIEDIIDGKVQK